MNTLNQLFKTETGAAIPGVTSADYIRLITALQRDFGISTAQICEAASYSFAMAVRVALGLSGEGANVAAAVADTMNGWTTLAALRHLMNAGTDVYVMLLNVREAQASEEMQRQLYPLRRMGAAIEEFPEPLNAAHFSEILQQSHALLCGLFDIAASPSPVCKQAVELMNEQQTPIHCVQAPPGVNPESGAKSSVTLFASSTLSLGLPLAGLAPGNEYCGRHYLCDISLPRELYCEAGADIGFIFAEQPVIRIMPKE